MRKIIRRIIFRIRWLFMSEKNRYSYLWARTKELSRIEKLSLASMTGSELTEESGE
jgi:hypothetical protein